jgi:fatty acid desaturase
MDPDPGSASAQASAQDDGARLAQAKRRVAAMKAFYIHAAVFGLVLFGLLAVDAATGGRWWVHWVFLGWGIGLVAHALTTFGRLPEAIAQWEERKLQDLIRK